MEKMYQVIEQLCQQRKTNVTAMCRDLGIGRSVLSELKSGRTQMLSTANTEKIAQYFGVSVEYLLGRETDAEENGEEVRTYLEQLKTRSEMRTLFRLAQNATKEDVEQAVKIIEALSKPHSTDHT